jgi:hypothetical protein
VGGLPAVKLPGAPSALIVATSVALGTTMFSLPLDDE